MPLACKNIMKMQLIMHISGLQPGDLTLQGTLAISDMVGCHNLEGYIAVGFGE